MLRDVRLQVLGQACKQDCQPRPFAFPAAVFSALRSGTGALVQRVFDLLSEQLKLFLDALQRLVDLGAQLQAHVALLPVQRLRAGLEV